MFGDPGSKLFYHPGAIEPFALVGAITVESILIPQQQALAAQHGCKGGSDAFFNSIKTAIIINNTP